MESVSATPIPEGFLYSVSTRDMKVSLKDQAPLHLLTDMPILRGQREAESSFCAILVRQKCLNYGSAIRANVQERSLGMTNLTTGIQR